MEKQLGEQKPRRCKQIVSRLIRIFKRDKPDPESPQKVDSVDGKKPINGPSAPKKPLIKEVKNPIIETPSEQQREDQRFIFVFDTSSIGPEFKSRKKEYDIFDIITSGDKRHTFVLKKDGERGVLNIELSSDWKRAKRSIMILNKGRQNELCLEGVLVRSVPYKKYSYTLRSEYWDAVESIHIYVSLADSQ